MSSKTINVFSFEPPQEVTILQVTPWMRLMIDEEHFSPVPLKILLDKEPDLMNIPEKVIFQHKSDKIVFSDIKRPDHNFPKAEMEVCSVVHKDTGKEVDVYLWNLFAEREQQYKGAKLIKEMRTAEGKLIHRFPPKKVRT